MTDTYGRSRAVVRNGEREGMLTELYFNYMLCPSVPGATSAWVNREAGGTPALPRSGMWKRTPSGALGPSGLGSDGQ